MPTKPKGVPPLVYDIVISMLLFALGGVLAFFSRGNNYLNLFAGGFIGAALASSFSSLLTTRIEAKIAESLERFDQAVALVQFDLQGARPLDQSHFRFIYQYYRTVTGSGDKKWRLTLYDWGDVAGSYIAKGKSTSVDTSGHANSYSAVMISVRGSLIIIETDPLSDEPSAINIVRREVGGGRLYGISRMTTWNSTNVFTPLILSTAPINGWATPEQDEHDRLSAQMDTEWRHCIHTEFLTNVM